MWDVVVQWGVNTVDTAADLIGIKWANIVKSVMNESKPVWGGKERESLWTVPNIYSNSLTCDVTAGVIGLCVKWHPAAWTLRPYAICFSLSWGGALCALANATLSCVQLWVSGFTALLLDSLGSCFAADQILEQCPYPAQQVPLITTLCVLRAVALKIRVTI